MSDTALIAADVARRHRLEGVRFVGSKDGWFAYRRRREFRTRDNWPVETVLARRFCDTLIVLQGAPTTHRVARKEGWKP
jgi:hypothetical protein